MEKMPSLKYIPISRKLHDECPNKLRMYEKKHPIKTKLYKKKRRKR